MDDWEDEKIAPLPAKVELKSNWDDEDVDEDEIKDSWEDDDEPALPPVVKPAPEKAPKKTVEKKGKAVEVPKESPKEESLDPIAEKLRQQRLVEEADYRSTAELFGVKDEGKSLDMFIPKSESDFLEYAEMISHRIKPYEKSYHYIALLKAIMRLSLTNMKAADVKDVASSITAITNEKLKAEKEAAAGKKKTGGKKKQLIIDKPNDDLVAGPYDAMDDFDFM
ncbi:PREDICTED: eukaryotic translation initiation factor 3 subunit J-like [Camelina sativa]|uniref:Eukaryotic translation initiation factor 3 subunit J n=1 Tax=Camelina sativa TaxID=90675 RepID=A0ABM0WFS5_CAMSA|nr:PREDICTED: eukaryotic translation initiation factor 3 subunit J-like [Camelina sativa]